MKNISLTVKLVIFFLIVGIIPFLVISVISIEKASSALKEAAYGQLVGMREVKKSQIDQFFNDRQGDLGVLIETVGTLRKEAIGKLEAVRNNKAQSIKMILDQMVMDIKAQQDRSICTSAMPHYRNLINTGEKSSEYQRSADIIEGFIQTTGYYDFFVIDMDGLCVHTQAREDDYHTNLLTGPYKDTGLGKVAAKALKGEIAFSDFAPYAPSKGEPAAFIGAPILKGGEKSGAVVLQISLKTIQSILDERIGLGETGEVYLVGSDRLMRSDSFVNPENYSVKASFSNPDKGTVDTESVRLAFEGKIGADVVLNYDKKPVLSAYSMLEILGTKWAVIAEMNVAEAFCPKDEQGIYYFKKYLDLTGYYDLFLINPDGYCFYTVTRESDYQSNFKNGKYADSNLGRLFQTVIDSKTYGVSDFSPYAPSNNKPCAFIAQPLVYNEKVEMVVALQLSLDAINSIMQQREGMGKTGETYLVGSDMLMRSDSFLDPKNHSVIASFASPSMGKVDTDATRNALSGKKDIGILLDYNGNSVLSAFTSISVGDTVWAMLAEIDEYEAFASLREIKWFVLLLSVGAILAIIVVALLVSRSIAAPINTIVNGMREGADQVASASIQVSSSSQSMAEGASEQAASIEETSSSMEEMSSMTRRNAENAENANGLMQEVVHVIDTANSSMDQLTRSMADISTASEETSNIIKTIDEIAFQTNLLALNAAVEAARAGEAGAGFAVVADEVRNLAMRAAEAAKNTAQLIDGTVQKVLEGSRLVERTNDAFGKVAESASRVSGMIDKISEASKEQSKGIEQVNSAITEMDKVVQQNAANAEESASAAEEMSAQAEQLKDFVGDLVLLVMGKRKQGAGDSLRLIRGKNIHMTGCHPPLIPQEKQIIRQRPDEIRPDQVIPFDGDMF